MKFHGIRGMPVSIETLVIPQFENSLLKSMDGIQLKFLRGSSRVPFRKDIMRVQQALDTTPRCLDQLVLAKAVINRLERASRIGLRLAQPWRVVLLGPVNAGKSSLINALAGYDRSIVSPHAGTTRDVLETRVVIDGWSVDFIDTAGFHLADNKKGEINEIEKKGINRASVEALKADLILHVQSLDQSVVDGFSNSTIRR